MSDVVEARTFTRARHITGTPEQNAEKSMEDDRNRLRMAYTYAVKAWRQELNRTFGTAWLIVYAIRDQTLKQRGIIGILRLENQMLRRKLATLAWYCEQMEIRMPDAIEQDVHKLGDLTGRN